MRYSSKMLTFNYFFILKNQKNGHILNVEWISHFEWMFSFLLKIFSCKEYTIKVFKKCLWEK